MNYFCALHYSIDDMIKEEYSIINELEEDNDLYIEESLKDTISLKFLDANIRRYEKNLARVKENYEWWKSLSAQEKEQERVKAKVLAQNAATIGSILGTTLTVTGNIVGFITRNKIFNLLSSIGATGIAIIAKQLGKNKRDIDVFSEVKQGIQYRVTIDKLNKDIKTLKDYREDLMKKESSDKSSKSKDSTVSENYIGLETNNLLNRKGDDYMGIYSTNRLSAIYEIELDDDYNDDDDDLQSPIDENALFDDLDYLEEGAIDRISLAFVNKKLKNLRKKLEKTKKEYQWFVSLPREEQKKKQRSGRAIKSLVSVLSGLVGVTGVLAVVSGGTSIAAGKSIGNASTSIPKEALDIFNAAGLNLDASVLNDASKIAQKRGVINILVGVGSVSLMVLAKNFFKSKAKVITANKTVSPEDAIRLYKDIIEATKNDITALEDKKRNLMKKVKIKESYESAEDIDGLIGYLKD